MVEREIERERETETETETETEEADELGLMELKAKLISRWAAYVLGCLKHLHQPRRKREKREEREREKKS